MVSFHLSQLFSDLPQLSFFFASNTSRFRRNSLPEGEGCFVLKNSLGIAVMLGWIAKSSRPCEIKATALPASTGFPGTARQGRCGNPF